jgi:hypothetical protein
VTDRLDLHERLCGLSRTRGDLERDLAIGPHALRIEGLDAELCARLAARWGGFLRMPVSGARPRMSVRVYHGGPAVWLAPPVPGERYRFEALAVGGGRVVASYHFALCAEGDAETWRLGVSDEPAEPLEQILDNAARYLAARLAAAEGGFALHAAGVLRDGRAYLFAGPSRSGKTTVVRLLAPARSLGDDFAMTWPAAGRWWAPAVPFDNAARIEHGAPQGLFPLEGIWRLHHAPRTRVERPAAGLAVASAMGCTAFPWALSDLAGQLLDHVGRFVAECRFMHLHFALENEDLWTPLLDGCRV